MRHLRSRAALFVAILLNGTTPYAAPVTVNGAKFDAPANCLEADGALVCKVDGQQMELWINRKPLAPYVMPTEPMTRKMTYFNEVHETSVGSILLSTNNDKIAPFSAYGSYSALGVAMPGKGATNSPSVRFASILHEEEVWSFLEVVAARTPAIDALSAELQRSLKLPATPAPVAASTTITSTKLSAPMPLKAPDEISPIRPAAYPVFSGPLLSMQYPDFLEPVVVENSTSGFIVNFKHKSRTGGPNLTINLRPPKDKQTVAATVVKERKDTLTAAIAGPSASVDINTLGTIKGVGFALIGVPDAKKGLSGIESIETTFAADAGSRLLDIRMTAEHKYSADAETVWVLLVKSLKLAN